MATFLTAVAYEESQFIIRASFTDSNGTATTPSSVAWTLTDGGGTVVNSRSAVSATPGEHVDITLSGDDLAMVGTGEREVRVLTVTADSTVQEIRFYLENLKAVS